MRIGTYAALLSSVVAAGCTTSGKLGDLPQEAPREAGTCERYEPEPGTGVAWFLHCSVDARETLRSMAVDAQGNLLVAFGLGGWDGSESAALRVGDQTIVNQGHTDTVVLTLSPEGDVQRVQTIAGPGHEYPQGLAACGDGFVVAWKAEDADPDVTTASAHIERYDADGEVAWSLDFREPNGEMVLLGLDCDDAGNSLWSGTFRDPAGSFSGGATDSHLFVLDPGGGGRWSRALEPGVRSAFAPNGDVVIVGTFGEGTDLGGGPLLGTGSPDLVGYAARYTSSGEFLWQQEISTGDFHQFDGISVADTIGITGRFQSALDIADMNFFNPPPEGGDDIQSRSFVAALDGDGQPLWARANGFALDDGLLDEGHDSESTLHVLRWGGSGLELAAHNEDAAVPLIPSPILPEVPPLHARIAHGPDSEVYLGTEASRIYELEIAGVALPFNGWGELIVARLDP